MFKKWRVIIGIVVVALVLLLAFELSKLNVEDQVVIATGEMISDSDFMVVIFPVGESKGVKRAVLARLAELKEDSIEVYVDGKGTWLARKNFTVGPQGLDYAGCVDLLNAEIEAWGDETDWSSVEYGVEEKEEVEITLTVNGKKGAVDEYRYVIQDTGEVRPLQIRTQWSPISNLAR